ncbi:MAG: hypothetical protein ACKOGA_24210 [Planctomycetaceae bacterium]
MRQDELARSQKLLEPGPGESGPGKSISAWVKPPGYKTPCAIRLPATPRL